METRLFYVRNIDMYVSVYNDAEIYYQDYQDALESTGIVKPITVNTLSSMRDYMEQEVAYNND